KEADYLVWRSVAKLEASERFLVDGPYMAGDRFTLADIAGYTIARASEASVAWDRLGRLKAWFDLVGSRDGVRRGLQAF
ncbi:glutathione binding-like protein, partial [Vibrio parahaemolyticus]